MASRGLSIGELTRAPLEEYLVARRCEGYRHALSVRTVTPLIEHLGRLGFVPQQEVTTARACGTS
jgi:hypothetical protein